MVDSPRIDTAQRLIHASAGAVWSAFADAQAWTHWLPPSDMTCEIEQFDFREGGGYRLALIYQDEEIAGKSGEHRDISSGTFLKLVPNERMVQLVEFDADDPQFAGSMRMTWQLDQENAGTRVTISAEDVPPGISPEDHAEGMNSTLENLTRLVENEP